jgi:hypothetical protein
VNDGRGPADFVVSEGSKDTSIVEFKPALEVVDEVASLDT